MAFNYSPKIVTDGLVLYLDAANTKSYVSGSTVWNDVSRGGNTGTLTNGPTFDTGSGGSIVFDGSDDYINFTSLNPITGASSFTLSGWLNVKTHSNYGIATFIGNGNNNESAFIGYVATAQNGTSNSIGGGFYGTNLGSGILVNTGWHYVALTYNGSSASIYIDSIITVTRNSYTPNLTNTSIRIGQANTGIAYSFNGNVGSTSLYNRSLSATEVLQNYNATKTRFGL
jgi:hypothetical protein